MARQRVEISAVTSSKGNVRKMSNGLKWMISIVIVCIMVGATVAVIYYVSGTEDPCTKILKSMSERKIIQGVDMNPMAMAACRLKFCEVDLSECPISCPFSYETDDKTQCPKSCECATSGIYQGDIRFGEDEVDRMMTRYGHREEEEFSLFFGTAFEIWNQTIVNGRMKVPYKMSPNVLYSTLDAWNLVVEDYGKKSCIDLIHWTDENDYLNVVETVNCASAVGRGFGSQMLELGVGCGIRATIQHELMHAFGFDHEQSRPDRDLHVTIHPENIEPYYLHNFDKLEERKVLDLGTEYEKRSGLHYGSDDFGINGATSMTFKPGEEVIITRTEERLLTEEDFRELNILYRCKLESDGPVVGSWKQWASWSECSVSCLKGYQTRSRDCYDPSGVKVGNCEGGTFEYRDCDSGECPPPDGIYDEWTEWGTCGRECGIGEKRRYRSCPLKYKNGCKGVFGIHHIEEQKTCQLKTCDGSPMQPIPTEWGSEWIRSTCGATCGGSRESLHLRCHCGPGICHIYNCDPEYSFTETAEDWDPMSLMKWVPCATEPCEGDNSEQTSVTEAPEVIQPTLSTLSPDQYPEPSSSSPESVSMWSEWAPWSACDKSCGDGHQSRSRQCSDFNCDGHGYEMMVCFVMSCPVPEVIQPTSSTLSPDLGTQYPDPWPSVPGPQPQFPDPWPSVPGPQPQFPDPWPSVPGPQPQFPDPWPSVPGPQPQFPDPWPSVPGPQPQFPDPWPSVPGPQPQFPDPWPSVPGPQPQFPDPWPSVSGPQPQFPDPWSSVPGPQPQFPDPWPSVPGPQPQFPDPWPSVPGPQPQFPDPWPSVPGPQPQFPDPWPSVSGPQPQFPDPWPSVPGPQPQFPDPWPSVSGPQPQFPDPWSSVPGPQPQFPDPWPSVPGPQSQFPDPWPPVPGPHPQFPNPRPPGPVIHPPHPGSSPFAPNPGLPNPTIWPSLTDSSWPAVTVEPVGTWSDWGPWGQCDKVCGNGHMIRTRNCLEYICTGVYYDLLPCLIEPCPGPPADDFSEYGDYVSDYFGEEDPSPTPLPNKDLFKTTWLRFKNFCPHGKLMTGYFNDDKFEDFLCYYKDGNIGLYFSSRSGVSEKLDWAGHTSACLHFDDVFARDVTGDGMDDLICRNTNTKNIEILINHGGSFSNAADWRGQRPICQKLHEVLNVEDLNGDGKADLVCGDHGSALQQVIFHE
ncbi:uncharacterized protein LOC120333286 isoform X2 [Styela clava]